MSKEAMKLEQRITDYLSAGGLFNPELADHVAVRDLLIDCREALAEQESGIKQVIELYDSPDQPSQQEPVAFEEWLAKQHGDPEEIGFLQALRIAYIAGQDSITSPPSQQEPVAYMGTDSDGNPNKFRLNPFSGCVSLYEKPSPVQKPVAYMDICEKNQMSGLRYWSEPDNRHEVPLYTSPPAQQEPVRVTGFNCVCGRRMEVSAEQGVIPAPQRTWVGLTKSEITTSLPYSVTRDKGCFHAGALWADAKLKDKNNA